MTKDTTKEKHQEGSALAEFKNKQREGTAQEAVPEAQTVEDVAQRVKNVTVKCLDNGSYRVGPQWYALTKGKNAVLPEMVAAEFRKNKLVE